MSNYDDEIFDENDEQQLDGEDTLDVYKLVNEMSVSTSTDYDMSYDDICGGGDDAPQQQEDESPVEAIVIETNIKVLTAQNLDKELVKKPESRKVYRFAYGDDKKRVFEGSVVEKYSADKYLFEATLNGTDSKLRGFTVSKIKLL